MASYAEQLREWAQKNGSDGCSWPASQAHQMCCHEHDFAYTTGSTFRGVKVTKAEADRRFRECIQTHSSFRWFSPMSWWRWLAVSRFGRGVWSEQPTRLQLYRRASTLVEAERARQRILQEMGRTQ